jgi:hypothetical protein
MGAYRVHGMFNQYGSTEKARVWVAKIADDSKVLREDTLLLIKDATGFTDYVLAGEAGLSFN